MGVICPFRHVKEEIRVLKARLVLVEARYSVEENDSINASVL